jgi:SulP family sulfate permease
VLITTFIATLLLDLEFAILLGVIVSLFLFLMETARPRIYSRVPDPQLPGRRFNTNPKLPECPQLKIVRIDGSIYFGAVDHVQKMLRIFERKEPRQTHLLIMAGGINRVDISGAEFLAQEARYRQARGGAVYLYRLKEGVRQFLLRGSYLSQIGEDNLFQSKTEAIASIFDRLDRSVCERCTRRIFHECQSVPGPGNPAEADERATQK